MQHPWDNSTIFYQQVKEIATGSLDVPKSARHKRETRFALWEGKCQITR